MPLNGFDKIDTFLFGMVLQSTERRWMFAWSSFCIFHERAIIFAPENVNLFSTMTYSSRLDINQNIVGSSFVDAIFKFANLPETSAASCAFQYDYDERPLSCLCSCLGRRCPCTNLFTKIISSRHIVSWRWWWTTKELDCHRRRCRRRRGEFVLLLFNKVIHTQPLY